jgi:hypothetical protein
MQTDKGRTMRAKTAAARQAFLYGTGDGKRVIAVKELSEKFGVHEQTIRLRMPEWEKEYEEILLNTAEHGFNLILSSTTLEKHKKDVDFIRKDLDSLKFEMSKLDNTIAWLEDIVNQFTLNTENGAEAISIFNAYVNASCNKQRLRTQFIAMEKLWRSVSGVDAKMDALTTRDKEIAKGQGKMDVEKLKLMGGSNSNGGGPDRSKIGGGVFAKPAVGLVRAGGGERPATGA